MSTMARLGAFIVGTLAILVVGLFIIGGKQYLFSSTYQLRAQFDNVAGLDAGNDVRVGGVHSGTVRSITLPHKTGEQITVVLDLLRSTHEVIKQDSVATIETEGLLGNQYVAISFGSGGTAEVHDNDLIASQPPLEMSALLLKASSLLDSSRQAVANTTQATANLQSVSAKIDRGVGSAGMFVNDRRLYDNLQNTSSTLRDTMVHVQSGVSDFEDNMEALKHNFLLRGYFKTRGYQDAGELAKNEIDNLPVGPPIKEFSYPARALFEKPDTAKLKNQRTLNAVGDYLVQNPGGLVVIVSSAGSVGDSAKLLILTQARAMVVREYLVGNFAVDDLQVKTLGQGKQAAGGEFSSADLRILIYAAAAGTTPPQ